MRGAQAISSVICHAEGPAAGQRVYDLAEAKTQWSQAGSEPGALNTPEPCKPQERVPLLLLSLLQAQGSCTASQQPQHQWEPSSPRGMLAYPDAAPGTMQGPFTSPRWPCPEHLSCLRGIT